MPHSLPAGADDTTTLPRDRDPDHYTRSGKLKGAIYDEQIEALQEQLVQLQYWIQSQGLKVLVIFEGRGSAGKGGVIKRITERTSPRTVRVVALPTPTERQKTQWYFQRYVAHLPAAGEMVMFDRSWYNRSNVEWVMEFCSEDQHMEFLRSCPEFERMLVRKRHHRSQILVQRVLRRADQTFRGAQCRTVEEMEALRDGPRRARALRSLLDGQGHHFPVHRHQTGPLVCRAL